MKCLGEVCERVTVGHVGITTPHYREDGVLFLRTQNVGESGLDLSDRKYITADFHAKIRKSAVRAGDILMSRVITHTVRCARAPDDLGQANCANVVLVRPGPELCGEFLLHYIRSPQAQHYLLSRKVGSAQLVVNTTVVQDWPIPLPPLVEQRRIVASLDEAFEAIETVKANAEKNLLNAHELFEVSLDAAFSHQGVDWNHVMLQDICTLYNGRAYGKDELLTSGKYPVLRVGNFFTNKHWYYSNLELDEHKYCDKGDLLYAWSASFGPRIWDGGKVIFHYHIWKVVPRTEIVGRDFLKYLLEWDTEKIKLAQGTGTTMMHVGKGSMDARVVPVPSLAVQRQIVAQLDAIREEVDRLTVLVSRKLDLLDELKRTLLQQAFAGTLTAESTETQVAEVA